VRSSARSFTVIASNSFLVIEGVACRLMLDLEFDFRT
jgi:hypothetical protein